MLSQQEVQAWTMDPNIASSERKIS
jgi:hypothetical protein